MGALMRRITALLLSVPVGVFACLVVSAWGNIEIAGDVSAEATLVAGLGNWLLASLLATWVLADSRAGKLRSYQDIGLLFFGAWMLLIPIYLFRTRGWRGLGPIFLFVLLWVLAVLTASGIASAPLSLE